MTLTGTLFVLFAITLLCTGSFALRACLGDEGDE